MIKNTGNGIVDAMSRLNISGNVIPHSWMKTVTMESGKPDTKAIMLLADIVYWYRPSEVRAESGELVGYKKRFQADLLQRSYSQIEQVFGFTKKEAQRALQTLERLDVVHKIFRTENIGGTRHNNIMYLSLNVEALERLTYPDTAEVTTLIPAKLRPSLPQSHEASYREVTTNTETSTETSTGTTKERDKGKIAATPLSRSGNDEPDDFTDFWKAYPKKSSKPQALKAWKAKSKAKALPALSELLTAIERWKTTRQWQDKAFIPNPATFINNEKWADDIPENNSHSAYGKNDNGKRRYVRESEQNFDNTPTVMVGGREYTGNLDDIF